jgi:hypothetical protein
MMTNFPDPNAWLTGAREPVAVYYTDADCVEYIAEDTTCVYERIDGFLTLIYDETQIIPVGFKLKGFLNTFERMREVHGFNERHAVELVKVVEQACCELGEKNFGGDTRRKLAYQAAAKLAQGVKLYDLPEAA